MRERDGRAVTHGSIRLNIMNRPLYRLTCLSPFATLALATWLGCLGCHSNENSSQPQPQPQPQPTAAPVTMRELPLIPIRNAKRAHGYLTGGEMQLEQVAEAKDKGYTRIIDLRQESEEGVAEERAKAEQLGLSYVLLPIGDETTLSMPNIQAFADLLAEPEHAGTTIVHCKSGNRVGALFALRAFFIDKKPAEEALQIGLDTGLTRLEAPVRGMLGL
jgi:protein tyrosine phosphatase (PTP) superfamily phosphohydrolase (DUF442 family)